MRCLAVSIEDGIPISVSVAAWMDIENQMIWVVCDATVEVCGTLLVLLLQHTSRFVVYGACVDR